jgi:hypothetical protein
MVATEVNKRITLFVGTGVVLALFAVGAYFGISRFNTPPQNFAQAEKQKICSNQRAGFPFHCRSAE